MKNDKPHSTILMKMPNGKASSIQVFQTLKGADIIFARSSEGELLVRLPRYAAEQLSAALAATAHNADEGEG